MLKIKTLFYVTYYTTLFYFFRKIKLFVYCM